MTPTEYFIRINAAELAGCYGLAAALLAMLKREYPEYAAQWRAT